MRMFLYLLGIYICFAGSPVNPPAPETDHTSILKKLNNTTLEKGKKIYLSSCIACHGADGNATLPQAKSFRKDKLRFGIKPHEMWQTITTGSGAMPAQSWLTPEERYYVVQYIRETFIRKSNPTQYFPITAAYLAGLPKPKITAEEQQQIVRSEALKGNLKYGQEWFSRHSSNYGTVIQSQLKNYGTNMLTVKLSPSVFMSYDLSRMGVKVVWSGSLDLGETKYRKYRGEGQPAVKGTVMKGIDMWQWTYGNAIDSLNRHTSVRAPLPLSFLQYHGHYLHHNNVVLSYAIEGRNILEMPELLNNNTIISQTLYISPGNAQTLAVGQLPGGQVTQDSLFTILQNFASKEFIAAAIVSSNKNISCKPDDKGRLILTVPESTYPFTLQVLRAAAPTQKALSAFKLYAKQHVKTGILTDLTKLITGGAAQWITKIKSAGTLDAGKPHFDPLYSKDADKTSPTKAVPLPPDYPYAVDDIPLPFNNPWNAWVRPTSLSFAS